MWCKPTSYAELRDRPIAPLGDLNFADAGVIDLASSQHAVCVTDAQVDAPGPIIRFVNAGYLELFTCEVSDVVGQSPRVCQTALTHRPVLDRVRQALRDGVSVRAQTINRRFDGDAFRVRWSIDPIAGPDGVERFVGLLTDVTVEDRLRRRLAALDTLLTGFATAPDGVDDDADLRAAGAIALAIAPVIAEIGTATVRTRDTVVDVERAARPPDLDLLRPRDVVPNG